jgi:hypothetical protein
VTTPPVYTQGLLGRKAPAVSPHCQNVATRVEIPVDDQPIADAALHPLRQHEIPVPVASIPPCAAKARVAGGLSALEPAKGGAQRFLQAQRHILGDLRVDLLQSWARVSVQSGQVGFLVLVLSPEGD